MGSPINNSGRNVAPLNTDFAPPAGISSPVRNANPQETTTNNISAATMMGYAGNTQSEWVALPHTDLASQISPHAEIANISQELRDIGFRTNDWVPTREDGKTIDAHKLENTIENHLAQTPNGQSAGIAAMKPIAQNCINLAKDIKNLEAHLASNAERIGLLEDEYNTVQAQVAEARASMPKLQDDLINARKAEMSDRTAKGKGESGDETVISLSDKLLEAESAHENAENFLEEAPVFLEQQQRLIDEAKAEHRKLAEETFPHLKAQLENQEQQLHGLMNQYNIAPSELKEQLQGDGIRNQDLNILDSDKMNEAIDLSRGQELVNSFNPKLLEKADKLVQKLGKKPDNASANKALKALLRENNISPQDLGDALKAMHGSDSPKNAAIDRVLIDNPAMENVLGIDVNDPGVHAVKDAAQELARVMGNPEHEKIAVDRLVAAMSDNSIDSSKLDELMEKTGMPPADREKVMSKVDDIHKGCEAKKAEKAGAWKKMIIKGGLIAVVAIAAIFGVALVALGIGMCIANPISAPLGIAVIGVGVVFISTAITIPVLTILGRSESAAEKDEKAKQRKKTIMDDVPLQPKPTPPPGATATQPRDAASSSGAGAPAASADGAAASSSRMSFDGFDRQTLENQLEALNEEIEDLKKQNLQEDLETAQRNKERIEEALRKGGHF